MASENKMARPARAFGHPRSPGRSTGRAYPHRLWPDIGRGLEGVGPQGQVAWAHAFNRRHDRPDGRWRRLDVFSFAYELRAASLAFRRIDGGLVANDRQELSQGRLGSRSCATGPSPFRPGRHGAQQSSWHSSPEPPRDWEPKSIPRSWRRREPAKCAVQRLPSMRCNADWDALCGTASRF